MQQPRNCICVIVLIILDWIMPFVLLNCERIGQWIAAMKSKISMQNPLGFE